VDNPTIQKDYKRVFCAIELPEEIRAQIALYIRRLSTFTNMPGIKWESVEKLHLTLKFLGEISIEQLEKLIQAAHMAALNSHQFKLSIKGTGVFPPHKPARIMWLGILDHTKGLHLLQNKLEAECENKGFNKEDRAFHPHLTIARIKDGKAARELVKKHREESFETPEFSISELVVMESKLGKSSSTYTVLERLKLGEV
jgi:RNA 2',3'-cyclic 3'-phosphodiesterase